MPNGGHAATLDQGVQMGLPFSGAVGGPCPRGLALPVACLSIVGEYNNLRSVL